MSEVGRPLAHESAVGHVRGDARYTDDLVGQHPNVLHAWPVLASHAHARILALDVARARAMPGVVAVLTTAEIPGENQVGAVRHDEPLLLDPSLEVSHHGQAIVWVLGETLEAAREGAAAVELELEPLPAILTMDAALASESFLTEPLQICAGEPEQALAAAPHQLAGELRIGGQEHFYLETHAALAQLDEDGRVLVHSSTQHPSETQEVVARVLGVATHAVTVQSLRMGGAFGGKEVQANPYAAVAALGAVVTGRPVRVRLDRRLDMILTGKRHPFWARYQVGYDDEGRILAVVLELFADGGWSLDLSKPILARALFHCDNAYRFPAMRVVGRVLRTHKCSQTAFRGFGGPQGMVVAEEILDRVARACRRPPAEVRALNFSRPGDRTSYGQELADAERMPRIWTTLLASAEVERRQAEIDQFNRSHPEHKRGLAITPVRFGISFTTSFLNQAGALLLIYRDGSIQLNHGGTEMGQGLHTKMIQVAADELGVSGAAIRVMPTRTDKVPNTSATAASSGSDLNGAAIADACAQLRARLAEVASRRLGVPAADLRFAHDRVFALADTEKIEKIEKSEKAELPGLAFAEVVAQAYLDRVQLFAAGYYRTPDLHYDEVAGRGKPFHYFTYGAAVAEVEVDGFTGQYALRRVDILHDVGDSISPKIDRGQIEGGFIQGLGWLCSEELVWDDQGRLLTRGASTYKLPSLGECPPEFHVELLAQAREPRVIKGSKAVGEPPFMLAIAVREALRAAVAGFGDGPERVDLACPSTPEAVYWAIERIRANA